MLLVARDMLNYCPFPWKLPSAQLHRGRRRCILGGGRPRAVWRARGGVDGRTVGLLSGPRGSESTGQDEGRQRQDARDVQGRAGLARGHG